VPQHTKAAGMRNRNQSESIVLPSQWTWNMQRQATESANRESHQLYSALLERVGGLTALLEWLDDCQQLVWHNNTCRQTATRLSQVAADPCSSSFRGVYSLNRSIGVYSTGYPVILCGTWWGARCHLPHTYSFLSRMPTNACVMVARRGDSLHSKHESSLFSEKVKS